MGGSLDAKYTQRLETLERVCSATQPQNTNISKYTYTIIHMNTPDHGCPVLPHLGVSELHRNPSNSITDLGRLSGACFTYVTYASMYVAMYLESNETEQACMGTVVCSTVQSTSTSRPIRSRVSPRGFLFPSSGGEANDCAIRLARLYTGTAVRKPVVQVAP